MKANTILMLKMPADTRSKKNKEKSKSTQKRVDLLLGAMADSNQNNGMEKLSDEDKSIGLESNDKQEELPSNRPEQVSGYSSADVSATEQNLLDPTYRIERKIDLMLTRIDEVEHNLGLRISAFSTRVKNTKSRLDTVEDKVTVIYDQQLDVKKLKDMIHEKDKVISELEETVDNIQGRLRRNTVIFKGVPKGMEGGPHWTHCKTLILKILKENVGFQSDPVIERAHRSPTIQDSRRRTP